MSAPQGATECVERRRRIDRHLITGLGVSFPLR
eukprot:COSAG01_NODE_45093_length_412_cov_3.063898_1_plen_32_part_10